MLKILPSTETTLKLSLINFVLEHGPISLVDEMMDQVEVEEQGRLDDVFCGAPVFDIKVDPRGNVTDCQVYSIVR